MTNEGEIKMVWTLGRAMEYTLLAGQQGLVCICIVQVSSLKETSGSHWDSSPKSSYPLLLDS